MPSKILTSVILAPALDATGVRWKWGQRNTGHLSVVNPNRLRPWSPEEEAALMDAAKLCGGSITRKTVDSGWRPKTYKTGFGFRVY